MLILLSRLFIAFSIRRSSNFYLYSFFLYRAHQCHLYRFTLSHIRWYLNWKLNEQETWTDRIPDSVASLPNERPSLNFTGKLSVEFRAKPWLAISIMTERERPRFPLSCSPVVRQSSLIINLLARKNFCRARKSYRRKCKDNFEFLLSLSQSQSRNSKLPSRSDEAWLTNFLVLLSLWDSQSSL